MTADAPLPDPSLPPPMDAVGGADALAEGGMLTLAGADDGAAPPLCPMPGRPKADGAMMRSLTFRGSLTAKGRCSLRAKALPLRALWPEAALPMPFLKNSPAPKRWALRAAAAA